MSQNEISRRTLVRAGTLAAAGMGTVAQLGGVDAAGADTVPLAPFNRVHLQINSVDYALEVEARVTVLDLLREQLQFTGTKKGCNRGECGACTILMDGRRVNACLVLAAAADGRKITTIEGLSDGDRLHPVQQAFIDHDAFQCGFCTPGQVMSAVGCVAEGHTNSDAEIREWMSGNICRCSAYPQIAAAVAAVAKRKA